MRGLARAYSVRGGEMLVAGVLAAVGVVFVWQAALLDLGDVALPGPGFFPLVLGAALTIFAVVIGIECRRTPASDTIELGHRDVAIVIAALLAVPLLFESLGAIITLGLLGTALLVLIGRVRLPLAIAAAGLGMAACWYFFQVLLGLQLPAGPV